MLEEGPAKKLVIYVGERQRCQGRPLYERLVELLRDHGVAGATATKAVSGFGPHGILRARKGRVLVEDVPVRIEVVERAEVIERILPFVYDMVDDGLVELLDTTVVKYGRRERHVRPKGTPHLRLEGRAKMLRIYVGESDRWEGEPLHEAIVKRLRMMDLAGATVSDGLLGYGASRRVHRGGGLFSLSADRPIAITVVDTEAKIRSALPILDEMVTDGLLVLSDVEIIKYTTSADWSE